MFTVLVTYGNTMPPQRFAGGIPSMSAARTLQDLAVSKGFKDATIYDEAEVKQVLREASRSRGVPGAAKALASQLHALWSEPCSSQSRPSRRDVHARRA